MTPRSVGTERVHESPAMDLTDGLLEPLGVLPDLACSETSSEADQEEQRPEQPQTDRLIEAVNAEMSLPVFALNPEAAQEWSQGQTRISRL